MIIVHTEATVEPVTLSEAKAFMGLDDAVTVHDTKLTAGIVAARKKVEQLCGRSLVARTFKLTLDEYTGTYIDLPFPPITSITSVKTYDSVGTATTLTSGTDYNLVLNRLMLNGTGYPVEIIYTTTASSDEYFKLAIKKQMVYDYRNQFDENGFDQEVLNMMSTVTLNLGY